MFQLPIIESLEINKILQLKGQAKRTLHNLHKILNLSIELEVCKIKQLDIASY